MRFLLFILSAFMAHLSLAQLSFSDVATARGVNVNYGDSTFGAGVSFVDFNDDGWDDLTLTTDETQELVFLRSDNGTFTEVTFPGIDIQSRTKQALWVDYDNDGDKDLLVTSVIGVNKLYNNNGSFSFTDVTASAGLFTDDRATYGATFGDIDNDGDLDLFITNRDGDNTAVNILYRNNNGVFSDITTTSGIAQPIQLTFLASFFDYDNDGDQDLYIINDKTDPNVLYENDGSGQFTDVSVISGAGIIIDAMSCTIGDYNNDGWFDIYVTNTQAGNYLLKNFNGTFVNLASNAGVELNSFSWGASFLDADLDGNLDLYVSSSMDGSVPTFASSAFYHHQGNNTYTIPENIGFENDTRVSFGNAIGDYNNDGKPDIVVMNQGANYFLWENQTTTSNNWIKIKLEGVVSNKEGIGNKIEVFAGGESQYRFTASGEGYLAQNSQYEFVGIGSATNIDYIKVTWNSTGQVETINNVQPNQSIRIQEGNGILSTTSDELTNVLVYPNPSNDGVYKVVTSESESYTAEVFDLSGRLVLPRRVIDQTIDLSSLSQGIYFARVYSDGGSKTFKLIYN